MTDRDCTLDRLADKASIVEIRDDNGDPQRASPTATV
jgi:hypothetical protein